MTRPALPVPRPGQYLTLRLTGAAEPAPVRSYSLSASAPDRYRISVKRESHGVASGYIGSGLSIGDELDVAAPRGEFVLGDADEPVVLLSAGIGVTPVLAMLQALGARASSQPLWWLHTTRGSETHAFAEEARQLVAQLPNARSKIFYTAADANVSAPDLTHGRLDRAALAELRLPTEAVAYICGPAGFMAAMTSALAELGLSASHIRTELFASLSSINPGVVAADRPAPHPPAREGTGPRVTSAAPVSAPRTTRHRAVCWILPRRVMFRPDGPVAPAFVIPARRRCCRDRSVIHCCRSPSRKTARFCCAAAAPTPRSSSTSSETATASRRLESRKYAVPTAEAAGTTLKTGKSPRCHHLPSIVRLQRHRSAVPVGGDRPRPDASLLAAEAPEDGRSG